MNVELHRNLYSLRHCLLEPVIRMQSACRLWTDKLLGGGPEATNNTVDQINRIAARLISEIPSLTDGAIDLESPDKAATQLQAFAIEWEKDIKRLSLLVNELNTAELLLDGSANTQSLRALISEGFQQFRSFISYMKVSQGEYLTERDGYAKVVNVYITKPAED